MSLRQKPIGNFMGRIRIVILIFPSMISIVILSMVLDLVKDKWTDLIIMDVDSKNCERSAAW